MKKWTLLISLFFAFVVNAQHHRKPVDSANVKFPYGIYIGVGPSLSGIDIYKNYFQNPHRLGLNTRLYYEFSNTMRLCGEFTRIPPVPYAPSWSRLQAFNLDLNVQFMARIKDEYSIFYFFMGVCRHQWKGLFIKQSSYLDAIAKYKDNTAISGGWYGLNIGAAVERAFKYFALYGEYRYRFTTSDKIFAVADVSINVGIKKKIPFKKVFRGLSDRYSWF